MKFEDVLPIDDYPKIEWAGRDPCHWLWEHEKLRYEAAGGHPVIGPEDVTYEFNEYGYRAPEFHQRAEITIVAIGCSYVFGYAMPEEALFHQLIAKKVSECTQKSVTCFNLGYGGASNDYIARTTSLVVPRLKPDLVLINFTWLARREYIAAHNLYWNFLPGVDPKWDPGLSECYQHLRSLTNEHDDILNFIANFNSISSVLHDKEWLFSVNHPRVLPSRLTQRIDLSRFVGPMFEGEKPPDYARDNSHPGPKTHELLCESYMNHFAELELFKKLPN